MDSERKAGGGTTVLVVAIIVLFPLFYVLSFGPFAWLSVNGYLPVPVSETLSYCYQPLIYASDHIPALGWLLNWQLGIAGVE
jgi:hypothetical protein